MLKKTVILLILMSFHMTCQRLDADGRSNEYVLLVLLAPHADRNYRPLLITRGETLDFTLIPCPTNISRILWKQYPSPLSSDRIAKYGHDAEIFKFTLPNQQYEEVLSLSRRFIGNMCVIEHGLKNSETLLDHLIVNQRMQSLPGFQFVVSSNRGVQQELVRYPQMIEYLDLLMRLVPQTQIEKTFYLNQLREFCRHAKQKFSEAQYLVLEKLFTHDNEPIAVVCRKEQIPYLKEDFRNKWDSFLAINPWRLFWNPKTNKLSDICFFDLELIDYQIVTGIQQDMVNSRFFISREFLPMIQKTPLAGNNIEIMLVLVTDLGVEYYPVTKNELIKIIRARTKVRNMQDDLLTRWIMQ